MGAQGVTVTAAVLLAAILGAALPTAVWTGRRTLRRPTGGPAPCAAVSTAGGCSPTGPRQVVATPQGCATIPPQSSLLSR